MSKGFLFTYFQDLVMAVDTAYLELSGRSN